MTIRLYDLVGRDDRRFSSNCCKTLYALAHKGLACETVPTRFTDISSIGDGSFSTIPVIEDGDTRLGDSWEIAMYLEATYPDAPPLFGGAAGIEYARFIARWVETRTHPLVMTMIVHDIYEGLDPADQPYFWESRTKRLGRPIDEVPVGREDRLPELRADTPHRRGSVVPGWDVSDLCRLCRHGVVHLGAQDEPVCTGRCRRSGACLDASLSRPLRWAAAPGYGLRLVT